MGADTRERPILFGAPMVRAILDSRKTQTRRVVKPQPVESFSEHIAGGRTSYGWSWWPKPDSQSIPVGHEDMLALCPYGQPGDQLWVRETWATPPYFDLVRPSDLQVGTSIYYVADGKESLGRHNELSSEATRSLPEFWTRRPSIHMPRWASRITLEITGVRVERLQEISASDALAEGVTHSTLNDPRVEYRWLWESIYSTGSWDANPWVWVIEFRKVDGR